MPTFSSIVRQHFASLFERPDAQIDLAYAALLVAEEEYPNLDIAAYLTRLDQLATRVRRRLDTEATVEHTLRAINAELFESEGLRGNTDDYYDPRNSFLNDVLDRKLGLPITVSIVYLAVGRRLGLEIEGIGLPGHFIVGVVHAEPLLIDPFNQGAFLSQDDCAERLRQIYGGRVQFQRAMLAPLTSRQILTRVLHNLKVIYSQRGDHARALAAIDRILLINLDAVTELRDRGVTCLALRHYGQALADFHHYLELAPTAPDADAVREAIAAVERERAWQN